MRFYTSLPALVTYLVFFAFVSCANFFPTAPIAQTIWQASTREQVTWDANGSAPSLAQLGDLTITLWTGGAANQTQLQVLGKTNATSRRLYVTPDPTVGESGHWYFLRFRGTGRVATDDVFSARFDITNMTGKFPPTIASQLHGIEGATNSTATTTKAASSTKSVNATGTSTGAKGAMPVSAATAAASQRSSGLSTSSASLVLSASQSHLPALVTAFGLFTAASLLL